MANRKSEKMRENTSFMFIPSSQANQEGLLKHNVKSAIIHSIFSVFDSLNVSRNQIFNLKKTSKLKSQR